MRGFVGTVVLLLFAVVTFPGCEKRGNESQLCPLLQQAYESAEGMSPGWYGRTANTLIEECQYGDTRPKDFRL